MIEIGQKVRFDFFDQVNFGGYTEVDTERVGTVTEIHEEHRWFSVEYDGPRRISFKFDDIGKSVFIVE